MGRTEGETCSGQGQSSAGKEMLARGVHKLPIGQTHQEGFRAEPRVHSLSGHCRKPGRTPLHSLSGYCRRPGSTSSVSTPGVSSSQEFFKDRVELKDLCLNFSCLGNYQDADSAEMVQNFAITDCSQGGSSCFLWVLASFLSVGSVGLEKELFSLGGGFLFLHNFQRVLRVWLGLGV